MKFGKMLFVGAASAAVLFGMTACSTTEDEDPLAQFRIKPEDEAKKAQAAQQQAVQQPAADAGNADLNAAGNQDAQLDNSGVSEWGDSKSLSPYDDFGTPITGLSFEPVYFKFDQSTIDSSETPKIEKVAAYIMSNPGTGVVIEGNCDDKGSDEYNRALGERRALAAKDYLISKGISDTRIRTVSYGEEKPSVPNTDDNARKQNRRDEFVGVTLKK